MQEYEFHQLLVFLRQLPGQAARLNDLRDHLGALMLDFSYVLLDPGITGIEVIPLALTGDRGPGDLLHLGDVEKRNRVANPEIPEVKLRHEMMTFVLRHPAPTLCVYWTLTAAFPFCHKITWKGVCRGSSGFAIPLRPYGYEGQAATPDRPKVAEVPTTPNIATAWL